MKQFLETVAKSVGILAAAFRVEADEVLVEAYRIGLQGCEPQQIQAAVATILQGNHEYMPTPGRLRELALNNGRSFDSLVAAAWECLNRGIDAVGYSGSVNFADGLINATVRHLGGWERVCGLPVDEFEKWYHKDFERTYLNFLRNGCPEDQLGYLRGELERVNARFHGRQLQGGGIYKLPHIHNISAPYAPQVLALPAPDREPVDVPRITFRPIPGDEPAQPERKSRIVKKDLPKHLNWTDKADLEYELTPAQLATESQNRTLLANLGDET